MGEICKIINGVSYNKNDVTTNGIKILRGGNIQNGQIIECDDDVYIPDTYKDSNNTVYKNDIVIVASTGSSLLIGKTGFSKKEMQNTQIGAFLRILRTNQVFNAEFINAIFLSHYYKSYIQNLAKGTSINNIKTEYLTSFLFPLPSLAEQHRIVTSIEAIFAQIDLLEQNKSGLQTAIKQAKSKILDLAIHGKLVPQDPSDEPASVLLEKLRAEKEEKIAKGEIKRDKNDSYICKGSDNCHYQRFSDGHDEDISEEIPFDVPAGWAWCRLGEAADIARGGSPRPIENFITNEADGINWIKIGDTAPESKYIISAKEKIKPKGKKHSRFVNAGDFLLTNSMSFGRPYILKIDGCIHDGWLVFADIKNYLLKDFLYYALSSQYIYNSFSLVAAGSTVKNLKADTVKQVLFPLPPLSEQQRIVAKIEELFAKLDFIADALTE